jgi:hypothetical protein
MDYRQLFRVQGGGSMAGEPLSALMFAAKILLGSLKVK